MQLNRTDLRSRLIPKMESHKELLLFWQRLYSGVSNRRGGGNRRGGVHSGQFSIEGGVLIEGGVFTSASF